MRNIGDVYSSYLKIRQSQILTTPKNEEGEKQEADKEAANKLETPTERRLNILKKNTQSFRLHIPSEIKTRA